MSLYDDIDPDKTSASGWASGIKTMHSQLAFKKATMTAPKREQLRRTAAARLPPVIDLKTRKDDDENTPPQYSSVRYDRKVQSNDPEWRFVNEYDPAWPNDYERFVKEMRERREKEDEDKRRQERDERERDRERRRRESRPVEDSLSGFSRRRDSDDEEEYDRPKRSAGAAIAPPPSLDDSPSPQIPVFTQKSSGGSSFGGSVAAKIMAKYGFKEGQGLGKSEQGIVKALEVEKTSKRGGRIVHETDEEIFMPPPPLPMVQSPSEKPESNIADMLRNPSKVVLLRNMVGPGEVDDELEPEVREECNSKYGPVQEVVIFEIPNTNPEEAVRIFVEFQRIESAVKAIVDLNGRFFGGRQVKAGFYDLESFKAYELNDIM